MSPFLDALANERRHNRQLRQVLFGVIALALVALWLVHRVPHHLRLHPAPNMRAGDVLEIRNGVAPVPDVNVYGFAYYLWQQVNRWARDGARDYGQQIFALQHYLTPACQEQLKNDQESRARAGELAMRTRALAELPGQAYTASRVLRDGDNAWTVVLDMHIVETVRGVPVKDAFVRYPVRVVRYDVDRERNPWGLALDCFGGNRPQRLEVPAAGAAAHLPPALLPSPLPPAGPAGVDRPGPSPAPGALPPPATLPAAAQTTEGRS
jgi:integrating conjugative element protein (TIGR03746 family)